MNYNDIQQHLKRIKALADIGDHEEAHVLQDVLFREFIRTVQTSHSVYLSDLANEVLKVDEINFTRWYS